MLCDNREVRVCFHGINKNIIVIYSLELNSESDHNEALWELAATLTLFLTYWDQNKHHRWWCLWSEILVAGGLNFMKEFHFWNSLIPTHKIPGLQALKSSNERGKEYLFLNCYRFPDRSSYWLRRNTSISVLFLPLQAWQIAHFEYLNK